jgi:hypothetical protein
MRKRIHRSRRRAQASPRPKPPGETVARPGAVARVNDGDARSLVNRILDTPHLARVVPQLQPEMLHRVIRNCGLEDCGDIVALATPEQLARVFDLDLWRADQPGENEQFDADRFGAWLDVLADAGVDLAAQKLASMDVDLLTTAFAQYILVYDAAAGVRIPDDATTCDVGGYRIVARRSDSWDAIVSLMAALDEQHPDFFHGVMHGCRSLSNSAPEIDGLDDLLGDAEQAMFNLASRREHRREGEGYAAPAEARAFLAMARQCALGRGTAPPANPVARAYFRAIESSEESSASALSSDPQDVPTSLDSQDGADESTAALVEVLLEAGLLPQQPRALLEAPRDGKQRFASVRTHMQFLRESNHAAFARRSDELSYLVNALVAGCSIDGRPLTVPEASDAAVAACNLGLQNWPAHWLAGTAGLPDDFLAGQDLIGVFQVGWTVLHEDVCLYAAKQLIQILAGLGRADDDESAADIDALRVEMATQCRAGTPWRARDALDVIAILDMAAWTTLLGLLDECPVIRAAIAISQGTRAKTISASDFEFISDNSQIEQVHEFVRSLGDTLRG